MAKIKAVVTPVLYACSTSDSKLGRVTALTFVAPAPFMSSGFTCGTVSASRFASVTAKMFCATDTAIAAPHVLKKPFRALATGESASLRTVIADPHANRRRNFQGSGEAVTDSRGLVVQFTDGAS
jgi:hypothetical protein